MRLTFRLRIDDPATGTARRFALTRNDIQYAFLPFPGDAAMLPAGPDGDDAHNMGARRVEERILCLDGSVILEFALDGLSNDVDEQVAAMVQGGYREVVS